MQYKVGQIFYLVGDTARVIPFRIVEEITRTTLNGMEKSFIAEMPDEQKTKVDVIKLKGNVFASIEEVRRHMISNAINAIDKMLNTAIKITEVVYSVSGNEITTESSDRENFFQEQDHNLQTKTPVRPERVQSELDDDIIKVDIGNGVIANLSASSLKKVGV